MKVLSIPIPDDLLQMFKMSDEEFAQEVRMLLAAKLYEMGKVTAGIAAKIAGVDRLTFLSLLSRYGVPAINLRDEEVCYEIEAARKSESEKAEKGQLCPKVFDRIAKGGHM